MINDGFMIAEVIFRHVFCRKTAKNGVMIVLLMRQHNLSFFNHLIAALIILEDFCLSKRRNTASEILDRRQPVLRFLPCLATFIRRINNSRLNWWSSIIAAFYAEGKIFQKKLFFGKELFTKSAAGAIIAVICTERICLPCLTIPPPLPAAHRSRPRLMNPPRKKTA